MLFKRGMVLRCVRCRFQSRNNRCVARVSSAQWHVCLLWCFGQSAGSLWSVDFPHCALCVCSTPTCKLVCVNGLPWTLVAQLDVYHIRVACRLFHASNHNFSEDLHKLNQVGVCMKPALLDLHAPPSNLALTLTFGHLALKLVST